MFEQVYNLLKKGKNLSTEEAWLYVIDREIQDEVVRLNTEDQLEEEGIDSLGRSLGEYSPYTIMIKRSKGQRTDHVTLKDTGAFYQSFRVIVDSKGMIIEADDTSLYDVPLTKTWGIEILGLTEENKGYLKDFLLEKYGKFIARKILGKY